MDLRFKLRPFLKTCFSLSLLLAMLKSIHKLTFGEVGTLYLDTSANSHHRAASISVSSVNHPHTNTSKGAHTPPKWDITNKTCVENKDLKKQSWFTSLDARSQQYMLYRHCRYYPILINHPEKCQGDVHLLIVVNSIIEQHDRREAIRRTWGQETDTGGKKVRTLFLIGTPSVGKDDRNLQKLIMLEDQLYGDILQWDFMDTFFNLTLKEVNFLKWFHMYCLSVQFIFKGDDDIFVHTKNILDFLTFRTAEPNLPNLFVGDIISRAAPIRNKRSKYYIPRELYTGLYPIYAGGGGFLMSSSLAKKLLTASEKILLFPIDDVFLGMCLKAVGVHPKAHKGFRTFGITRQRNSAMNTDPCFYRNLLVVHRMTPEQLIKMWQWVHDTQIKCAKVLHF